MKFLVPSWEPLAFMKAHGIVPKHARNVKGREESQVRFSRKRMGVRYTVALMV